MDLHVVIIIDIASAITIVAAIVVVSWHIIARPTFILPSFDVCIIRHILPHCHRHYGALVVVITKQSQAGSPHHYSCRDNQTTSQSVSQSLDSTGIGTRGETSDGDDDDFALVMARTVTVAVVLFEYFKD